MPNFIYLFQGEAKRLREYAGSSEMLNRDAVYLSYDEPVDGFEFYPKSTWAEGRNKLMELAEEKGEYLFYIYCDDDLSFRRGGWSAFEEKLLKYRPSIGVPVVPKTSKMKLPFFPVQHFRINDEQLIAIRNDVFKEKRILPYVTKFDSIHWWASCLIQETLIQTYYSGDAIQINTVEISNDVTTRYFPDGDPEDESYKNIVYKWLEDEGVDYKMISKQFINNFGSLLLKSLKYIARGKLHAI